MSARDALLDALIPQGVAGLPGLPGQDPAHRRRFWARFDATAPPTLRGGLAVVAVLIVRLGPWLTGAGRGWDRLDPTERDGVLQRIADWPSGAAALDLAGLVACMCWFDDDVVQDRLRAPPPPVRP